MFKVGDQIRQIGEFGPGNLGALYVVKRVDNEYVYVREDGGELDGWLPSRFELVANIELKIEARNTLPTDSTARKDYPLFRGVLRYFPAALAGIAKISKLGNDKHNPGQELHHARGKSNDHGDCVVRHLLDTADLLAALERGEGPTPAAVLNEVDQLAWRALAFSQELHERFGAPMAPGAKK